ncbi:amidohydrolase [Sphingobium lactosutens]|uniref:amidohydrolase n=1 Tax=Sphingobium lactosutens TaxID=522773 RepID=UPI00356497EC
MDDYSLQLSKVALQIWDWAELGFHEQKSAALLQTELKKAGFAIKTGVSGMPTAFVASFKRGTGGPVIGLLAEFDALPGISQTAQPSQKPRPGKEAAHACGHNLLGAGSLGAAIAVSKWMTANNIQGEVRLYGTPAEEGGGAKVYMTRDGLFNDVGAVLSWHPSWENSAAQYRTLAVIASRFTFVGQSAAGGPSPEQGRSALDGVEAMDNMVNMMREHVPQDTRIHYIISDGGKAPNVVPSLAKSDYMTRHPVDAEALAVFNRVVKAGEGAALGTATKMNHTVSIAYKDMLQNDTLGRVVDKNLRRAGTITLSPEELVWAEAIRKTLPNPEKSDISEISKVQPFTLDKQMYVSTDVGDISYVTPTSSLATAAVLPGTPGHSWQFAAAAGSSIGVKATVLAAKTMALSAAELMTDPTTLAAAKAEMEERRGGAGYTYKSMIGSAAPNLNYRDAK